MNKDTDTVSDQNTNNDELELSARTDVKKNDPEHQRHDEQHTLSVIRHKKHSFSGLGY